MSIGSINETGSSPRIIEWTINDFFQLPQDAGYSVSSPEFKYLQSACKFSAMPNGTETLSEVTIFALHGIGKDGTTHWQMELRRANGTLLKKCTGWKEDGEEMVMDMYIPSKEVEKGCKATGFLKVRCTLACDDTIYNTELDDEYTKNSQTDEPSRRDKLIYDLEEMFFREDYCDATIVVGSKEFKVHRCIIGVRAPVFFAKFRYELTTDPLPIVRIDECDADTFQEFLHYLYCGRLGRYNLDIMFNLRKIADKYQITELKQFCLEFIIDNLTIDTFCDAIVLVVQSNKQELVDKALQFLSENLAVMKESEKWQKFEIEQPEASEKLMEKAVILQEQRNSSKDNFFQKFVERIRGKK